MNGDSGNLGAPSMNRTAAMNVSSKQASWRLPVIRQRSSYIAYGSRPSNSAGDSIPQPAQIGGNCWADVGDVLQVSDLFPIDDSPDGS